MSGLDGLDALMQQREAAKRPARAKRAMPPARHPRKAESAAEPVQLASETSAASADPAPPEVRERSDQQLPPPSAPASHNLAAASADTASGDTASADTASGDTASADTASGDTASDDSPAVVVYPAGAPMALTVDVASTDEAVDVASTGEAIDVASTDDGEDVVSTGEAARTQPAVQTTTASTSPPVASPAPRRPAAKRKSSTVSTTPNAPADEPTGTDKVRPLTISLGEDDIDFLDEMRILGMQSRPRIDIGRSAVLRMALRRLRQEMTPDDIMSRPGFHRDHEATLTPR